MKNLMKCSDYYIKLDRMYVYIDTIPILINVNPLNEWMLAGRIVFGRDFAFY